MEILNYLDHRIGHQNSHNEDDNDGAVRRAYHCSGTRKKEMEQIQHLMNHYDCSRQKRQRRNTSRNDDEPGGVDTVSSCSSSTSFVSNNSSDSSLLHRHRQEPKVPFETHYSSTRRRAFSSCSSSRQQHLPLDVFPTEVLRLLICSGYMSTKEIGKFGLFTSKAFVNSIGSSYVWKCICCQYWPIVARDSYDDDQIRKVGRRHHPNSRMDYYENLFYQLSRSAKLRSLDYNHHKFHNHIGISAIACGRGRGQQGRDHFQNRRIDDLHQLTSCRRPTPPTFSSSLDSISFTITIRGADNDCVIESHRLTSLEMTQVIETGNVRIPRRSNDTENIYTPPRQAYWHIWKTRNTDNQNRSQENEDTLVTCLNESCRPVWNSERNAYQFLTSYVALTPKGRLLEHRQQKEDVGFGGLKFQVLVSSTHITLEIRKRHGKHPAGLYRSKSNDASSASNSNPSVSTTSLDLLDFLQELAGWGK